MNTDALKQLLARFKAGDVDETGVLEALRHLPFEEVGGFAKVDHHRSLRTGFPEVVYGKGKTTDQVLAITAKMVEGGTNTLVTRIDESTAAQLVERFPEGTWLEAAGLFYVEVAPRERQGYVLVVTAGTTDIPAAEEAAVTAELNGCNVDRVYDVGVAGVHRLMAYRSMIDEADVVIVAAGMEGALASVVASISRAPVIALPTSIGYGASFGGLAALLGMMTSCAAGVTVVNIDNGVGAGTAASLIIHRARERAGKAS